MIINKIEQIKEVLFRDGKNWKMSLNDDQTVIEIWYELDSIKSNTLKDLVDKIDINTLHDLLKTWEKILVHKIQTCEIYSCAQCFIEHEEIKLNCLKKLCFACDIKTKLQ